MCALDVTARKSTGIGAISQAILDVAGPIDDSALRHALRLVCQRFPIIHGKVARDWLNLAPYWKAPADSATREIPLQVVDLAADESEQAARLLEEHANQPFGSQRDHLRLIVVRIGNDRSRIGLVFDHRLFDAFGAESFLRMIDHAWRGTLEEIAPRVKLTEPAHLDRWMERFKVGKKLNRMLMPMGKKAVCALARPAGNERHRVRFVQASLTAEESARLEVKSAEEIGVPILLPSAAARAVVALRRTVPNMPRPGGEYVLFTSANARSPGQEWESLFFNQFSFLLFKSDINTPPEVQATAVALRDQLFSIMRDGIPNAMKDATALARIIPTWAVAQCMRIIGMGRMCSLYFACVRESGYPEATFMGLPTQDLVHLPLAFFPPGLNLCMTRFGDRFNLVLSYVEGALDALTAERMMREFKALLVA